MVSFLNARHSARLGIAVLAMLAAATTRTPYRVDPERDA